MNNRLVNSVKLPFAPTRGSVEIRQEKARQLVDKLYNRMQNKFVNGKMHLSEFQEHINAVIPNQLNVQVLEGYDSRFNEAYSDIIYDRDIKKIIGSTIELSTNNHYFSKDALPILMHEFQHVTDQIFHPKILSRDQHMINSGAALEKYEKLYNDVLYISEFPESKSEKQKILKRIEHKFNKFLRKRPTSEKIDYIQNARYTLEMENQAYKTETIYAQKMKDAGEKVKDEEFIDFNKIFMLDEKIQLLKRMGFEIIQKERKTFASKIEKLRNVNSKEK